jgi:hypothetical protein
MENLTKVLLQSMCPHCSKEIFVEVESAPPIVRAVLGESDIVAAKEFVITKINEMVKNSEIESDAANSAIDWVNEESTIFGPNDVQSIIDSIKN